MQIEDLTNWAMQSGAQIEDARHPLRFRATASGDFRPGSILIYRRQVPSGNLVDYGPVESETEGSRTVAEYCPTTVPFEVIGAVTCGDGNVTYDWLSPAIVWQPQEPTVSITGVQRQPNGKFQVNQIFSLFAGEDPWGLSWRVYSLISEGVWATTPTKYYTNSVSASPGDKIEVYFRSCANDAVISATTIIPPPTVTVTKVDGDGQRAVVLERAEKPLKVKVTSSDPYYSVGATWEVISAPGGAKNYSVISQGTAADGTASAIMVVGDKAGPYVVRVKGHAGGVDSTNEVTFTTTAVVPSKIGILKDSPDPAALASAYAISSTAPTTFYSVGLDGAGAPIGLMKTTWTISGTAYGSKAGAGTLASPSQNVQSAALIPSKAGQLTMSAKSALKGVPIGSAELFLTKLYVSVQNTFDVNNPVDDAPKFVPGMYLDGTNVALNVMETTGQFISLHLITGQAAGTATFTLTGTTSYPGICMNYPLQSAATTKDMMFTNGLQNITVDFNTTTGDTWVLLLIQDYGASGTINVSIQSGTKTYALKPLKLPIDSDGNGLPDPGWKAGTSTIVSSAGLQAVDDTDNDGNPATPQTGDGLSAYEELRGLVATQTYMRLDPRRRDFFVVADHDLLAFQSGPFSATPISYLTPLPMWNHYLELEEVAGEYFPARELTKIKPVVNPNRAGVPGARADGQRAVRAIYQTAFWPAVTAFIPAQPAPIEQQIPIWQYAVYGATVLDTINPEEIDRTLTGELASAFVAQSPDDTSFVEWYAKTFENSGVHTDFTDGLIYGYHDENGNEVPACVSSNDVGCDVWEDHLIVPRERPGEIIDELHTVPEYTGDYYTRRAFTCADMVNDQPGGASLDEFTRLKAAVVAHELGHAMHIDHHAECGQLMFQGEFFGIRRSAADIVPIPSSFSQSERAAIRLHDEP